MLCVQLNHEHTLTCTMLRSDISDHSTASRWHDACSSFASGTQSGARWFKTGTRERALVRQFKTIESPLNTVFVCIFLFFLAF